MKYSVYYLVIGLISLFVAFLIFPPYIPKECNSSDDGGSGSTATSGKLFKGTRSRQYVKPSEKAHLKTSRHPSSSGEKCEKWSVVTTIFSPSDAVKKQAKVAGWCIVIVGDKKGPFTYNLENKELGRVVFLSYNKQRDLMNEFPIISALPWNHFGRKNVGYLYAISRGAKLIWDFDDDNALINDNMPVELSDLSFSSGDLSAGVRVFEVLSDGISGSSNQLSSFNPYPLMGAPHSPCWPRGFPLDHIKNSVTVTNTSGKPDKPRPILAEATTSPGTIGIVQSLANHDPDVDAIYRLTQPLPFDFLPGIIGKYREGKEVLVMTPATAYAPYNAQATLHYYSSLWSLLLPVTVHGRVSDIWRGYIAQRIGREISMRIAFTPPLVTQHRNVHSYLADLDSEEHLYKRSGRLLQQLDEWTLHAPSLPGKIEELWILMYEHGYLEARDVELCQVWLESLAAVGYTFPPLAPLVPLAPMRPRGTVVKANITEHATTTSKIESKQNQSTSFSATGGSGSASAGDSSSWAAVSLSATPLGLGTGSRHGFRLRNNTYPIRSKNASAPGHARLKNHTSRDQRGGGVAGPWAFAGGPHPQNVRPTPVTSTTTTT